MRGIINHLRPPEAQRGTTVRFRAMKLLVVETLLMEWIRRTSCRDESATGASTCIHKKHRDPQRAVLDDGTGRTRSSSEKRRASRELRPRDDGRRKPRPSSPSADDAHVRLKRVDALRHRVCLAIDSAHARRSTRSPCPSLFSDHARDARLVTD